MKASGLVLKSRAYTSPVAPPDALEDESRFGNDGAFLGAGEPAWVRLPSGLWVMDFDGVNDTVSCGYSGLDALTNASILIWARPDIDFDSIETARPLWSVWKDVNNGIILYYSRTFNEFRLTLTVGGAAVNLGLSSDMKEQRWWFSAATLGSSGAEVYLNGAIDTTNPSTTCFADIAAITNHYLSSMADMFAAASFSGSKVGYRIYTYALTPAQIYSIFQAERSFFGV